MQSRILHMYLVSPVVPGDVPMEPLRDYLKREAEQHAVELEDASHWDSLLHARQRKNRYVVDPILAPRHNLRKLTYSPNPQEKSCTRLAMTPNG